MNRKKLYRLYSEEGLARAPPPWPQAANRDPGADGASGPAEPAWSLDFVSDALDWGRRFRILAIVDDFTREALALVVDTSIGGRRLARELDALVARRGRPAVIVSDTSGVSARRPRISGAWASTRRDRRSPPSGPGRMSPCRSSARHRLTLAALTPKRAAASRCVAPSETAATTRVRRSTESAFDMPAGLPSGRQLESEPKSKGNPQFSQLGFRCNRLYLRDRARLRPAVGKLAGVSGCRPRRLGPGLILRFASVSIRNPPERRSKFPSIRAVGRKRCAIIPSATLATQSARGRN